MRLFDLYRGAGLPEGTKSLAFTLRFGADKTLRDKEVDGRVRRIVQRLESEHGATAALVARPGGVRAVLRCAD